MKNFISLLVFTSVISVTGITFCAKIAAGEAVTSWEFPTARVDGSPLDSSEIGATSLVYSCDGDSQQEVIVPYPSSSYAVTGVSGSCQFVAAIIDASGVMSAYSEAVVKQISVPPVSPVVFKVDIPAGLQQLIQACIDRTDCEVVN